MLTIHSVEDISTAVAKRKRITATYHPVPGQPLESALLDGIERQIDKRTHIAWLFVYDDPAKIDRQVAAAIAFYVRDGLDVQLIPLPPKGTILTRTHRVHGGTITLALHREVSHVAH